MALQHLQDLGQVTIPDGNDGGPIRFGEGFNVSVPFIDRHIAEGRADKLAIRTLDGEDVRYGDLHARVCQWSNHLRALGLQPGDRQLMVVKDAPEFFYFFWGAIRAGIVPVPLNTLLRAKDYGFMIADSGARLVLYSEEFAEEVAPALAALAQTPAAMTATAALADMAGADTDAPVFASTADSDCFWLYSSGSTGTPKGTIHRQRDMVVTSQHYGVDVLGITAADIFFSAAKLFFAYGLGNGMSFPLWVGGTAVLAAGRPTPALTFEAISRFKPTLYFGVPTLYAAQLQALAESPCDMTSIRYCVSAGEALPADIFRRWQEATGLTILDGIGSTEALHIFLSNSPDVLRPGTSGQPVPGYEARIVDDEGQVISGDAAGTLLIRGASTAREYWNNPAKTDATMLADGWLSTGDTYRRDADGFYVYEGRSDDMIKVGGIWTSPIEIEARLIEHPQVLEAAIVGRADDQDLVKPEAWIVLKNPGDVAADSDRRALEKDLHDHVKAGLAPYKYPRWWHFVEELPKTATGKIQRFRLRQS